MRVFFVGFRVFCVRIKDEGILGGYISGMRVFFVGMRVFSIRMRVF